MFKEQWTYWLGTIILEILGLLRLDGITTARFIRRGTADLSWLRFGRGRFLWIWCRVLLNRKALAEKKYYTSLFVYQGSA